MGVAVRRLETAIPAHASLLIDTNVLIAYLEERREITEAATLLIDRWVHGGRNRAFVAMVSAMEILVGPLRANLAIAQYLDFLGRFPNLTCVPLELRAAEAAARVRAQSNLKPPDALIVGTAVAAGADIIVTNDGAWAKKSPKPVVILRNYLT
ncbi:MAG: type II toxin-antitoxin system VapC family toxin [Vulcanimicrobiaceae bacterium]